MLPSLQSPTGARLRHRTWRNLQGWMHERQRVVRDPQITRHRLRLPHLPASLAGFTVVQLSDIHYGMYLSRTTLVRTLELAQSLRPDLIALTGDFVTQSPVFIEPVCEMLGRLRAPHGVYAVLGNHDFRSGAQRLTAELTRRRIQVLRNRFVDLEPNGVRMRVAGVDDYRQRPSLAVAVGPARPFTLLLAHNPLVLPEAAALRIDLVLSGHTHGGQVKFRFAEAFYQRYLPAGFLGMGATQMYVSRGLGKVIVPMRLGSPPELAHFTLQPGDVRTAAGSA